MFLVNAPAGRAPGRGGGFARKLTLLCVAALTVMASATISAALPGIVAHFEAVPNAEMLTRLVLSMPGLSIAIVAPLSGWIIDRYGRRQVLLAALVLYAAAGTSGLWAGSLSALLAGRALLGFAVAATMTTATALVGDYFEGAERDRLMGIQASFMGFGGLLFLTGGGLLAEVNWRAPFAIYAVALLLVPMVHAFLPEPVRRAGMPHARPAGGGGRIGLPILGLFALAFGSMAAFYMLPIQLPFYLAELGAESPVLTGFALGVMTLTSALTGLAFGWFRARMGRWGLFSLGFAAFALSYGGVFLAGGYRGVVLAMPLTGVGMGLLMPNLMATAIALAPAEIRGRVSGGITASIFAGQFLSPLLTTPLIASRGYAAAYGIAGVVLAAIAALLLALGAGLGGRARAA